MSQVTKLHDCILVVENLSDCKEKIQNIIRNSKNYSSEKILGNIIDTQESFCTGTIVDDDIITIVIKIKYIT